MSMAEAQEMWPLTQEPDFASFSMDIKRRKDWTYWQDRGTKQCSILSKENCKYL